MTEMTGGRVVVEGLRAEQVDCVFGLIGSATMEIFDALYDAEDIRFIGVRDERTGAHMADGYARASGRAGVMLAGQNGPGATNLVTGIAQAHAAFSPVVALAGSLATGHVYRDAFQEVDQQSLFRPITKKTWTVNQAARIPEMMREAFRVALSPRRGPVVLNFPRDVLAETVVFDSLQRPASYRVSGVAAGAQDAVEAAASLVAAAQRPLIIAGGGVKNGRCHGAVLRLAETINAPVAMSPGHGDAIPYGHPLNAGQVGPRGNPLASCLAREADVILALGTRLGFNTTFYSYDNINQEAAIVQVDTEPTALGRYFPIAVGIVGDAGVVAQQLVSALSGTANVPERASWVQAFQKQRAVFLVDRDRTAPGGDPIQPARLFKALRAVLPQDTMITLDAGTLCLQATDALNYYQPPCLFTPLDFGLVGFSYACGLGVKAACPERTVVSLMGDGGFGMTVSELGTAVQHQLNTVVVVMNNGCWGAEKAYQRDFFDGRYIGVDVSNPPYDRLAELYGARGFRVQRAVDLERVISEALACGQPAVVDVPVDPNALYSFRRDSFKHRVKA